MTEERLKEIELDNENGLHGLYAMKPINELIAEVRAAQASEWKLAKQVAKVTTNGWPVEEWQVLRFIEAAREEVAEDAFCDALAREE